MANFIIAEKFNAIVKNLFVIPFKWTETIFLYLGSFGKRKLSSDLYSAESPNSYLKTQNLVKSQFNKANSANRVSFWKNKWNLFLLSAVLATSFMVYLPCLQYGFVNWDDPVNIYRNPDITNISDWGSFFISVKNVFSTHICGNYNPLTITTFAFEKLIYGTLWSHELEYHPDNLFALYNRGEYYKVEGRYKEALYDFNKYIALHPVDHHVFVERSVTYAQLHMYDNALQDLGEAEKLDSSHSDIYKNRSVIHARLGNYDKSHWELEKYLRLKPDDIEMWSILATLKGLK
ncbi:MAG: hypothetical protein ABFR35_01930 [Thermodesulfobacteriota bacterium]